MNCRPTMRTARLTCVSVLAVLLCGCLPTDTASNPVDDETLAQRGVVGCYAAEFNGLDASQLGCGLISTFGDPLFDLRFTEEIGIQSAFWQGVPATVYAFDECSLQQANAIAMPNRSILMGYWLSRKIIIDTGSELPVAGVLAHEWGHQVQFQFGWAQPTEPTVRRIELEADMWSGFYMALAKGWTGNQLNSYFQTLFDIGDFNFHSRGHHGTPNQRLAAGVVGFDVGVQVFLSGQRLSYVDLHTIFTQEIDRIVATIASVDGSEKQGHAHAELTHSAKAVSERIDRSRIDRVLEGLAVPGSDLDDLSGVKDQDRLLYGPY